MKKLLLLGIIVSGSLLANAQLINPITWSFTAVKVSDKLYEIHMKANIQDGWHLYSQAQPGDAIVMPTTFTVNANPLFIREGKIKEVGKMELMKDASLGISANQYATSVDFVQKVKLKASVKTNFTGNVEFQTCDDKKCLPPKKINFSIVIQ
ncbi:MAG TPA: protein-disulfide reductase DsbD domain-containing protein [Chitinophagaceae bacterium]|jgi:thiol:disulfide interchange protein DsbD|nr:protein-disulfide reductase DsbD domain-containing protein [Chitinophagaceae bacterium]